MSEHSKFLADLLPKSAHTKIPAILSYFGQAEAASKANIVGSRVPVMNECVTCDQPEAAWDPFDPLYICGGAQCPGCTRADLNAEATLEHAEAAS
ncbi:hypothetical protein OHA01_26235 [Micromonospora zamorensis]|uniref:hypothetical protein n=1 Tax=Micromonospora zamorensis TaxID=709883 RepID=UPI003863CA27|nr:hypothetical protein OHA01_26235 [Micromonospora zamorensis]